MLTAHDGSPEPITMKNKQPADGTQTQLIVIAASIFLLVGSFWLLSNSYPPVKSIVHVASIDRR
jgi:hypothetical protein